MTENGTPIYVTKPFLPPFEEFVDGLKSIWDSSILTNMGPLHDKLTQKLLDFLKVDHLSLVVNGHLALEIALNVLEIKGEVITTPFSFASTTHSIVRSGLKPVFCDINFDDYNLNADLIEPLITQDTSAILPVHVYGTPCNIAKIEELANKYDLKVIYDAAHAFGVEVDGKGIGAYGDVSMFSFHATKVFNTIEGGALVYSDPYLERLINLNKNFGISSPEDVPITGTNAKFNEFQALMGLLNIQYVDEEIKKREEVVNQYKEFLSTVKGLKFLPVREQNVKCNHAYFPILIDEKTYGLSRNELSDIMMRHNIFPRKYFYPLITDYSCYRSNENNNLPVAKYVSDRILCLPLWGGLNRESIEMICTVIIDRG